MVSRLMPTFITVTNTVNLVSFDAEFITSTNGAQGLLSVYWDTNTVGSVDEQAVKSGLQHYMFKFPNTITGSTYMLGFRLDRFTSVQSSVIVTNVTLGQIGVSQPFSLAITTNTFRGLQVYQLTGQSGFTYKVQASTNLIDWADTALLVNTNGIVRFIDHGSTNYNQWFYRVVAPY